MLNFVSAYGGQNQHTALLPGKDFAVSLKHFALQNVRAIPPKAGFSTHITVALFRSGRNPALFRLQASLLAPLGTRPAKRGKLQTGVTRYPAPSPSFDQEYILKQNWSWGEFGLSSTDFAHRRCCKIEYPERSEGQFLDFLGMLNFVLTYGEQNWQRSSGATNL